MGDFESGEVWKKAPQEVKGMKRMVLGRMAAYANDRRIVWVGLDTLMQETAGSRSAVYEAVSWLLGKGYLQEVAPEVIAEERIPYDCVVRRVTEVEYWDSGCPAPVYRGEIPSPESGIAKSVQNLESDKTGHNSGASPESGLNIKPLLTEGVKENMCSTSYYAAEPRSQGKPKSSWKSRPEDDDLDPRKYLDQDHDKDATTGTQRRTAPRSTKKRVASPDSAMGLAWYYRDAVSRVGEVYGLDVQSMQILASHIKRWRSQGDTPDKVRAMVDLFVADPGLRSNGTYAWKDFVARRAVIAARIDANALSGPPEAPGTGEAQSAAPERSQGRTATDDDYVNPFA